MGRGRRWFRWGRRGGASTVRPAPSAKKHQTSIVIPDVRDGGGESALVAVACDLLIVDHGSELGGSVTDALGLGAAGLAEVTDGWPVVVGEQLKVELHPVDGESDQVAVAAFGSDVRTHVDRAEVSDRILTLVTRHVLDTQDRLPHLHGGAVADPDGNVVLILGSSGAGKSTLTAHLAATDGWQLITDEQITLFPEQKKAGGFTRPVAIKRAGLAYVPQSVPPADEPGSVRLLPSALLGCRRLLAGHPALIVLPDRGDSVNEVSWATVEPAAAAMEFCANNLDLVRRPAEILRAFGWLASTTPTVRLRYQETISGAAAVRDVLEGLTPVPEVSFALVQPREPAGDERSSRTSGDVSRRVAMNVFTLAVGAESILFHGVTRELIWLDAEATQIWVALGQADTTDDEDVNNSRREVVDLLEYLADRGFLVADSAVWSCMSVKDSCR